MTFLVKTPFLYVEMKLCADGTMNVRSALDHNLTMAPYDYQVLQFLGSGEPPVQERQSTYGDLTGMCRFCRDDPQVFRVDYPGVIRRGGTIFFRCRWNSQTVILYFGPIVELVCLDGPVYWQMIEPGEWNSIPDYYGTDQRLRMQPTQ